MLAISKLRAFTVISRFLSLSMDVYYCVLNKNSKSIFVCNPCIYLKNIRIFHKLDEIGNNANIGIRGLLREIKSSDKMLPPEVSVLKANVQLVWKGECWTWNQRL